MNPETRKTKLEANADAIARWQRKLFRAATELKKLTAQRKRLLGPPPWPKHKYRNLDEIRMAGGGSEFNDELPI
jgi:hypothetical protein